MFKKWLRRVFRLCDHEWHHATNIITARGPQQVLMCYKCSRFRYVWWKDR